jgi:hypothetical protein
MYIYQPNDNRKRIQRSVYRSDPFSLLFLPFTDVLSIVPTCMVGALESYFLCFYLVSILTLVKVKFC